MATKPFNFTDEELSVAREALEITISSYKRRIEMGTNPKIKQLLKTELGTAETLHQKLISHT